MMDMMDVSDPGDRVAATILGLIIVFLLYHIVI
jgi:hypothetical protein